MRVVKPIQIGEANLVSTTAGVTTGAQVWSTATAYAAGAQVEHRARLYRSMTPANTGNIPGAASSADKWLGIGPANAWAMFDAQVSSQTTASYALTVVLRPLQHTNSLVLLNMRALTASIVITDGTGGPVVYSRTELDGTVITDYYEYFFEPYAYVRRMVLTDIPPYANATITIRLTSDTDAAVGYLSCGTTYELGDVDFGASVELRDYSQVSTDKYGTTTYLQGKSAKDINYQIMITAAHEDRVLDLIASLSGVPCVWVGPRNVLTTFGICGSMRMTVQYPTHTLYNLTIKGMT